MISLAGDLEFRICHVWALNSWRFSLKVESIAHNSSTVEICLNFVPWVINGSTDQPSDLPKRIFYSPIVLWALTAAVRTGQLFWFFLGFARKASILMDSEEGNPAPWFPEDLHHEKGEKLWGRCGGWASPSIFTCCERRRWYQLGFLVRFWQDLDLDLFMATVCPCGRSVNMSKT